MKKIKQILKKFKKVSVTKKALLAVAVLAAVTTPAVFAVWGPNRPAYDYNDPIGRLGSTTGPVFNSMKNTPTYGDEFNFTTARKTTDATWSNDLKVKDGDQIEIRVLIHNNGNSDLNTNGISVAKGVKAGIDLPQNQYGIANEPIGFVNATNSAPKEVFDSTKISTADGKRFKIDYTEGSTILTTAGNKGSFGAGKQLSDSFISKTGTLVGSNAIDGTWYGCYEYYGWVIVKATIIGEPVAEVPNYTIKKFVNNEDAQNNQTAVKVEAGKEFEYRVDVTNTGDTELKNIKVWDVLPTGVNYVDNTLKLDGQTINTDDDFFNPAKGVNVDKIAKGAKRSFTFKAIIPATTNEQKEKACNPGEGTFYNNVAKADPEGPLPQKDDPAVVNCNYTPPKKEPAVEIQKDVSKPVVAVNEVFTYTVKVTNTGNIDLKNVKVDDPAPANIVFEAAQQTAGITFTFNPYRIQAVIAELKKGESKSFSMTAKVTKYVPTQIINTACVNADEVNPEKPEQSDDCDDVPVTTVEFCPVPGKENLPKGSTECSTPTEIPSTGAGALLAVSAAIVVAAVAYLTSTKMNKAKTKKVAAGKK